MSSFTIGTCLFSNYQPVAGDVDFVHQIDKRQNVFVIGNSLVGTALDVIFRPPHYSDSNFNLERGSLYPRGRAALYQLDSLRHWPF